MIYQLNCSIIARCLDSIEIRLRITLNAIIVAAFVASRSRLLVKIP